MTPAPASRRDVLLDDSVAALRMVIAQLRELEAPSMGDAHDHSHLASSRDRSDRH